jgi:hypothetical protein
MKEYRLIITEKQVRIILNGLASFLSKEEEKVDEEDGRIAVDLTRLMIYNLHPQELSPPEPIAKHPMATMKEYERDDFK